MSTRHLPVLVRGPRPITRGDCVDGARPCSWVNCRYHIYYDARGPMLSDLSKMKESCVLDVADRGGATLPEIGEILGISGERARQVEVAALEHLKEHVREEDLSFPEHEDAIEVEDHDEIFTADFNAAVARAYRRIVQGGKSKSFNEYGRRAPRTPEARSAMGEVDDFWRAGRPNRRHREDPVCRVCGLPSESHEPTPGGWRRLCDGRLHKGALARSRNAQSHRHDNHEVTNVRE